MEHLFLFRPGSRPCVRIEERCDIFLITIHSSFNPFCELAGRKRKKETSGARVLYKSVYCLWIVEESAARCSKQGWRKKKKTLQDSFCILKRCVSATKLYMKLLFLIRSRSGFDLAGSSDSISLPLDVLERDPDYSSEGERAVNPAWVCILKDTAHRMETLGCRKKKKKQLPMCYSLSSLLSSSFT